MINIEELLEGGIIRAKNHASFCVLCTIIEIDYPKCFICKSGDEFFAFIEIEKKDSYFGWDVSKVSLQEIDDVNNGKADVQSLFRGDSLYVLFYKEGNPGCLEKVSAFEPRYSMQGSKYTPNFCDMDATFDYHGFAIDSKQTNSNKISIVLQNAKGCVTGVFLRIVNQMTQLCKQLAHPFDINGSIMSVQHASTVVSFSFADEAPNLLGEESEGAKGFAEFANLLAASNPIQLLSNQSKTDEKKLQCFERMTQKFVESGDVNPRIVFSTPKKQMPVSYPMNARVAEEKLSIVRQAKAHLKSQSTLTEYKKDYEGILTGIVTGTGNYFGFKTVAGIVMKGNVDFGLVGHDQFDVGGSVYMAKILTKRLIAQNGEILKENHTLVGLETIRPVERYKQIDLI